jgi:hypothetical protein
MGRNHNVHVGAGFLLADLPPAGALDRSPIEPSLGRLPVDFAAVSLLERARLDLLLDQGLVGRLVIMNRPTRSIPSRNMRDTLTLDLMLPVGLKWVSHDGLLMLIGRSRRIS